MGAGAAVGESAGEVRVPKLLTGLRATDGGRPGRIRIRIEDTWVWSSRRTTRKRHRLSHPARHGGADSYKNRHRSQRS